MTGRRSGKKDRILNTRISEELDEELRRAAERMDVSVSQLVRRILSKTVDMVGNLSGNVEYLVHDIVEDVASIADAARPGGEGGRDLKNTPVLQHVIGWQPMKAQRRGRCALTGEVLDTGADAWVSVRDDGGPALVIGARAFHELTEPQPEPWVELVLTRDAVCAETERPIAAGTKAWMRVGSTPPEIISQAAWSRRRTSGT